MLLLLRGKSIPLIMVLASILWFSACSCTVSNSLSNLRDLIEQIAEENVNTLDAEMESYFDVQHYFTKSKRYPDSYALLHLADLQANISLINYAVKQRSVIKLENFLKEASSKSLQVDELDLIVARTIFRTKLTCLELTALNWKRSFHLIKRYENSNGMNEILHSLVEKLGRDPLTLEGAQEYLERVLNGVVDVRNKLKSIDESIDNLFECSGMKSSSGSEFFEESGNPLANMELINEWINENVNAMILETIAKNEKHLHEKVKDLEVDDSDLKGLSLEGIERELLSNARGSIFTNLDDDYSKYLVPT